MPHKMTIISIGELLWDVFDDSERLGGAVFNFSLHLRRMGHEVCFVSAVGEDARGRNALREAAGLGLATDFIQRVSDAPTGIVTVRLDETRQPTFTIHRPAAYDFVRLDGSDLECIWMSKPEWVSFGTLFQMAPAGREATRRLIESNPAARRFYDVNLRPDSYSSSLVEELLSESHVVKLNEEEAVTVGRMFGLAHGSLEEFSRCGSSRFGWEAVSVTRGARGCAILTGGGYEEVDGYPVEVCDTVGAGDAFAAAFLHGLQQAWDPGAVGDFANRVAAVVASKPGAVPPWSFEECMRLAPARRRW